MEKMKKILASVLMFLFIVGLVSTIPVIASEPVPGKIIDYTFMGTLPPDFDGIYDVDIYYITYETYGGLHIKGMLGIPAATPTDEGWPVTVFMHGGFGHGAWNWPYVGEWTDTPRTWHSQQWASHGFVSLSPWLPGNPPSEGTYTPVSQSNAKAALDGLRAVINLAEEHPQLEVDETRLVVLGNCLGSQTLIRLASIWPSYAPELQIKALGVGTFNPSALMWCQWQVTKLTLQTLPPESPQGPIIAGSTAVVFWQWLEEDRLPYTTAFKEDAIEFLQTPIETPAGVYPRVRAGPLEASVGIWAYQHLYKLWGRPPTTVEMLNWMFTDDFAEWLMLPTLEEKVAHPWYQTTFQLIADYDPLTEGNIRPFNPDIPLLVVHHGGSWATNNIQIHMGTRNRQVVEGWGWEVYEWYDPLTDSSLTHGSGHTWAVNKALELLYA